MSEHPGTAVTSSALAEEFPSQQQGLYFNHAAISPWPRRTAEAVIALAQENLRAGPVRYAEWIRLEQRLRDQVAALIGAASAADIAFLKNTTEGISTVAWGLDWKAGDNLVLPREEFPSNWLPWLAQQERGVAVREIDIRSAPDAEQALLAAMDDRTRLLAVSSVQWNDGFRLDLETLGKACHERKVLFFVDAIQHLGALRIDVQACHISFLAADAHKWLLAPEGIAIFYSSEQARPLLKLHQVGWHMFDYPWAFDRQDWTPSDSARRFEAGSPNSIGQAALSGSVQLLLDYGMEAVEQRVLANSRRLICGLQAQPGIEVVSRAEPRRLSGIVSFKPRQGSARRLHHALAAHGMACAIRNGAIRLSPHFYQDEADMDQALALIAQSLEDPTSCEC